MQKKCHNHLIKAFYIKNLPIFGGGERDAEPAEGSFLINLSRNKTTVSAHNYPMGLKLNTYLAPSISINWPDMSVPDLRRDFWLALIEDIKTLSLPVSVMCFGGHGRTGTALSILASLSKACLGDPVLFIRERYCRNAVETQVQLDYIAHITGKEVREKPNLTEIMLRNPDLFNPML